MAFSDFTTFFRLAILNQVHTFFLQLGYFCVDIVYWVTWIDITVTKLSTLLRCLGDLNWLHAHNLKLLLIMFINIYDSENNLDSISDKYQHESGS